MSMVYTAVGTSIFALVTSNQQAQAVQQNAEVKGQIDEMNAQFAELDAYKGEQFGYSESARYESVIDSTVADQRVGYASQGVDVNYGTAKEMQQESKLTGALNVIDIQRQARQKAMGFNREASNIRLNSSFGKSQAAIQAGAIQSQGLITAVNSGVSGYAATVKKPGTAG